MYLRTVLIVFVLAVVVVFALLNWAVFTTPTTLSIGFTTFEAPLGLILLGVIGTLTFLFLVYLVYLQATALMESRQYSRELKTQREIADHAEESRFIQLRSALEQELRRLHDQAIESGSSTIAKLNELDHNLRATMEQSTNTITAYIGEIEDRLERTGGKIQRVDR